MSLLHPIKERPDGRKVRYAVVGAGWIAQEDFMPGVEHTGNSVMTALVTGDAEKAKEIAEKYGIEHVYDYDGFDTMLQADVIDAIYLATPNSKHTPFVVKALEAGIHVLCEKPMAPTEEECLQMIAASEKSGAKLMIAYRLHFEEATIEAIMTVREGKIGRPRFFSSTFSQQVSGKNSRAARGELGRADRRHGAVPDQRRAPAFRGGADGGIRLFGASSKEERFEEIDEMNTVVLRFPGDRLAQFTVSYGANPAANTIVGTEGSLEVEPGFTWLEPITHKLTIGEEKSEKTFDRSDHFGGETQYFSNCMLDNEHPEPDGEEGLADVRVIKAMEESIKTGKPVAVTPRVRKMRPNRAQIVKLRPVKPGEMVHASEPEKG